MSFSWKWILYFTNKLQFKMQYSRYVSLYRVVYKDANFQFVTMSSVYIFVEIAHNFFRQRHTLEFFEESLPRRQNENRVKNIRLWHCVKRHLVTPSRYPDEQRRRNARRNKWISTWEAFGNACRPTRCRFDILERGGFDTDVFVGAWLKDLCSSIYL